MRRRVLRRLDQLIIGARTSTQDIPSAAPREAVPLSDKEEARLSALNTKRQYNGPLTPAEAYEREGLLQRRTAR